MKLRMIKPVTIILTTMILTTVCPAFAGQRTTIFIRTEQGRRPENVPKDAELVGLMKPREVVIMA